MSSGGGQRITDAITSATGPAICAYVTAGYPNLEAFPSILHSVAAAADVVEVGVPFTDPMADGMTIQRASHIALENGVTLQWVLDLLTAEMAGVATPVLLMGYYNPFLAYGLDRLGPALAAAGVAGLIVPDLPHDEAGDLISATGRHGIALVQLVTPSTPTQRLARLAEASDGFVYAVTTTGVTGGQTAFSDQAIDYLQEVKGVSEIPVMAGFGIRDSGQVSALAGHVDGVVIGSALIEAIDRAVDPGEFLNGLRVKVEVS